MQKTTQQRKNKGKINFILIMILLFTIIPIIQAIPQIQLISQTNPLEYGEIQAIILNIASNTTITQALIEFEEQNHTLQKEDPYYTYSWVPIQKGTNNYKVYATNTINETQTYNDSFEVQDTIPPEITETQPQGMLNYNLIELKAITNENSTCKYDQVDVSYDSMTYTLSGEEIIHTALRSLGEGEYTYYVKCKDTEDNIGQTQAISFTIDTQPPTITSISPTGTITQKENNLRLNTDEIATCKWSKTNQEYPTLENHFQTTGATLHEQPVTLTEGINTYHISCQDQQSNYNDPTITINIELNQAPKATISINKNSTYKNIKQGTYEINLEASEPLSETPTLSLGYPYKTIHIPLEGSQENWKGYLIIPIEAGDQVGEFSYTGKDTKGTTGTEITEGKLVLIDTIEPPKPSSLRLYNENNKIKISWEYEGEKIHHYNIYRSTTGNTDKTNYKYKTTDQTYQDADVTHNIGYFYRISAVDNAGNEGDLTEEEFLMTKKQDSIQTFEQDPELLAIINTKITQAENKIQELDIKITELEETTNQEIQQIIQEQELISQQKNIKSNIQTLIGELKTYRDIKLTKTELDSRIGVIDTKIKEYEKEAIKEIIVKSKIQNEQITEEKAIQETIDEYLKNKAVTEEQRQEYITRTKTLQQEIRIQQEIVNYEIEYKNKENQEIILIKETILAPEQQIKIIVQEYIPKEVIKITELDFKLTPTELNTIGAQWILHELENSEIRYTTLEEKDFAQLQKIKTILLYDLDEFLSTLIQEEQDSLTPITGEAVTQEKQGFSLTQFVLIPLGVLVIIALLVYYFAFLKTENKYENEIITRIEEQEKKALKDINIQGSNDVEVKETVVLDTKSDLSIILSYVNKAYLALEQEDISQVYENYSLALMYYKKANFGLKNRVKANFEINNLYEKIILKKKAKHLYT